MSYRRTGTTVAVSLLLAAAFVVVYVLVMDRMLDWTSPSSKALIAAQMEACEARSDTCFNAAFRIKHWALDALVGIVPLVTAALPVAIVAAFARLRPWICGFMVAAVFASFLMFENIWLLFAPMRMPGWLFVPMAAMFVVLVVRGLSAGLARIILRRLSVAMPPGK